VCALKSQSTLPASNSFRKPLNIFFGGLPVFSAISVKVNGFPDFCSTSIIWSSTFPNRYHILSRLDFEEIAEVANQFFAAKLLKNTINSCNYDFQKRHKLEL
jgi:hypothetical protein